MPPVVRNNNKLVSDLFQQLGLKCTTTTKTKNTTATNTNNVAYYKTKAQWCLREGMNHIIHANNGALTPIMKKEGIPTIYLNDILCHRHNGDSDTAVDDPAIQTYKDPQNCFQSLCRIIAGQQLAGSAATTIWSRLVATTENDVCPNKIIELAELGIETHLQKPAGLSRSKSHSIVALSKAFIGGDLSESFLASSSEEEIREALLNIKGIGPWSCDMFLIFYLERPNVFPMGDLAVRKGVAKLFSLKGSGPKGSLCPRKDAEKMEQAMQPYEPFRSIATYYMYKIVDATADDEDTCTQEETSTRNKKKRKSHHTAASVEKEPKTPTTKIQRKQRTTSRKVNYTIK